MKPYFRINSPAGPVYEIKTEVVALNRAAYYHAEHADEFPTLESAMEDTVGLFTDDARQIRDWAANNMNWDELQPAARLVRFDPQDVAWHEGEWEYFDQPAILGELDGATVMRLPVELVMNTMAVSGQLCNVTVMNGPDNQPYAAAVLIVGQAPIINAYIQALQTTGEFIMSRPAPEAQH